LLQKKVVFEPEEAFPDNFEFRPYDEDMTLPVCLNFMGLPDNQD
jgi:hypothetical protein